MGAAEETEREQGAGARTASRPAGARGEAAARKQAWKSCRFSAAAAAEGEGRNRVQRAVYQSQV